MRSGASKSWYRNATLLCCIFAPLVAAAAVGPERAPGRDGPADGLPAGTEGVLGIRAWYSEYFRFPMAQALQRSEGTWSREHSFRCTLSSTSGSVWVPIST